MLVLKQTGTRWFFPLSHLCPGVYCVMDPMHECRGLCLASAATRKGDPSALASSTDTSGQHDKLPVHTQTCRMCSVVRHRMCAVLPWPPGTLIPCHQEPNYSFGGQCPNCLSLRVSRPKPICQLWLVRGQSVFRQQAEYSSNAQNMQEEEMST